MLTAMDRLNPAADIQDLTAGERVRRQQQYPFRLWYGVIIRHGYEQEAADDLKAQKVLVYWPNYAEQKMLRKHQNGGHRRRCVLRPIIPGYLFCPSAGAEWRAFWAVACGTRGVVNVVRTSEGKLACATEEEIGTIRQIEADTNGDHAAEFKWAAPGKVSHKFKIGELVRFLAGACAQLAPGKIERLLPDGRIRVEAPLMGRSVPFDVWPHQIEAV